MKTRREFLQSTLTGVAASWTLPGFLHQSVMAMENAQRDSILQAATGRDHPILVVLQLGGGNDGLNTVVPFVQDAYYAARPNLRVAADGLLKVSDQFGLNPVLDGIKALYDDGHAALINGVGYPNPNRSHFRSMEIWHTASDSDKNESYGWLGRYFDNTCGGAPDPAEGIALADTPPQAFHGPRPIGISMKNPKAYRFLDREDSLLLEDHEAGNMTGDSVARLNGQAPQEDPLANLDFLKRTALDAEVSSDRIQELTKNRKNTVDYPASRLASDLALVSQLIAGGMPTRVYYVNHGGFDTHANQINSHDRLLGEFSQAVTAFCRDLKKQRLLDRVLVMCFSEFGRRVQENASGGTDHGVAGPMFLFGGNLKAGCYGTYPDLTDLTQGDLKHNVDFRSVYATIIDQWMKSDSQATLKRPFPQLDLFPSKQNI